MICNGCSPWTMHSTLDVFCYIYSFSWTMMDEFHPQRLGSSVASAHLHLKVKLTNCAFIVCSDGWVFNFYVSKDPQTSWAVMSQYIPWGLLAAEKQQVARALMEVHFSKNEVPSCSTSSQLEWWCDAPFIEGWRICEPNCCHGRWLSNRAIPGPLSTSSLRVKWLCLSHLGGVFSSFSWWNNGASKFHDAYLVRASFTWYNKHALGNSPFLDPYIPLFCYIPSGNQYCNGNPS